MAYHPEWMTKPTYDSNEDNLVDDSDKVDGADAGVAANNVFKIPSGISEGDIFYVDASGNVVRLAPGTSGQFLKTQGANNPPIWADAPTGVDEWIELSDTPSSFSGGGGKLIKVKSTEDGLEFGKAEPSGDIVGTTDEQTLSNKTIVKPKVKGDVYASLLKTEIDGLKVRWDDDASWCPVESNGITAHDSISIKAEGAVEFEFDHPSDEAQRWRIKRSSDGSKLQFIHYPSDGEQIIAEFETGLALLMNGHAIKDIDYIWPKSDAPIRQIGGSTHQFEAGYIKTLRAETKVITPTIEEATTDGGVTIDGCQIKDGKAADTLKLDGSEPGVSADKIFKIPSDITQGDIFYVDASGNIVRLPAGSSGQFLKTQGAGANPTWATAPGGWNVTSQSADYTASDGDVVLVDASGGAVTITLPSPSSGARVRVKKTDSSANAVTVSPSASETIDGASSHTISDQYEAYEYVSDGTNWYIF